MSVPREIVERIGLRHTRYEVAGGRYIVNESDLRGLRLTAEEYVNGIDARIVSDDEARELVAAGGYNLGGTQTEAVSVETDGVVNSEEKTGEEVMP